MTNGMFETGLPNFRRFHHGGLWHDVLARESTHTDLNKYASILALQITIISMAQISWQCHSDRKTYITLTRRRKW